MALEQESDWRLLFSPVNLAKTDVFLGSCIKNKALYLRHSRRRIRGSLEEISKDAQLKTGIWRLGNEILTTEFDDRDYSRSVYN